MKLLKYCWKCHVNYDDECLCEIKNKKSTGGYSSVDRDDTLKANAPIIRNMTLPCQDPYHSKESISSQVYEKCPTCNKK